MRAWDFRLRDWASWGKQCLCPAITNKPHLDFEKNPDEGTLSGLGLGNNMWGRCITSTVTKTPRYSAKILEVLLILLRQKGYRPNRLANIHPQLYITCVEGSLDFFRGLKFLEYIHLMLSSSPSSRILYLLKHLVGEVNDSCTKTVEGVGFRNIKQMVKLLLCLSFSGIFPLGFKTYGLLFCTRGFSWRRSWTLPCLKRKKGRRYQKVN